MKLSQKEKEFLIGFIKENSGIIISEERLERLEKNIYGLATRNDFHNFYSLIEELKNNNSGLVSSLMDIITINETFFFRDIKPFKIIEENIFKNELFAERQNIRVWCAACASGQEPYSVAMSFLENKSNFRNKELSLDIMATDLCKRSLEKAEKGCYNQFEVQRGVPSPLLVKYFDKVEEFEWKIKDDIKKLISFKRLNLINDPAPKGEFDIIFCRNVLIYFDDKTKEMVVKKISGSLKKGGSLFLGSAETKNWEPSKLTQNEDMRSHYYRS